ncbi:hypothetical protein [Halomonas sp. NCCP-2165]|nr:hypothetical protein [Halomonas sp. NCCP-2165]GKW48763.1 hypothetical protein NCCP2165_09780 [Halomonas sp. NCCP-2165]
MNTMTSKSRLESARGPSSVGGAARWMMATVVASFISFPVGADTPRVFERNPGVNPGDIVVLRRVEPAPIGRGDRHAGPIVSKVNTRDGAMEIQQRLEGGDLDVNHVTALSDDQAAGVSSGVTGMGAMHRILGTGSHARAGAEGHAGQALSRAAGSLGGGGVAGGVSAATSNISGTVGQALAPLSGRN